LRFISPYRQLNRFLQKESFEPVFSWGVRMAIAATLPVLWGVATGRMEEASWITLTAECICWVELKGSAGQRVRVLLGGMILALLFGILGSITGTSIWLSLVCMLGVGFISGLFKNLGDRGSGLAISIYVLFILTNAYPTHNTAELQQRALLILAGGAWNALVGVAITLFMPEQQPYRRTIALIWRAIGGLIASVSKGWDGKSIRSSIRDIYQNEKEVRGAIDSSLHFYESMAHQLSMKDGHEYELAQLRKATAIIAANIITISEELESFEINSLPTPLRLKLYSLLKALQQASERMAVYVVTLKPEEKTLTNISIGRLKKLITLLVDFKTEDPATEKVIARIAQLAERTVKIMDSAILKLEAVNTEQAVFRSYSLVKTVLLLHPKHWWRNIRLLFNLDSFTTRYAIRTTIAATAALFIDQWFEIDHGYWIPFTAMIVTQPYFGATFKKALERVAGTILGGFTGALFLRVPTGLYLKELMLFASFVLMVYYIRKNYSIAAFFITLSLVLLFNMEAALSPGLIITRALSTMGGAALAIVAGFALLPYWDSKWMPVHIANAVRANYEYFAETFNSGEVLLNWTKYKRNAETKNSNAFDSFTRYLQEPGSKKHDELYFRTITHIVRITRELNNIHLEQDNRTDMLKYEAADKTQEALILECRTMFNKNMQLIAAIAEEENNGDINISINTPFLLTEHQELYMEKLLIEMNALHEDLQLLAVGKNAIRV
jgi:uncharacterized membrane protein YccC